MGLQGLKLALAPPAWTLLRRLTRVGAWSDDQVEPADALDGDDLAVADGIDGAAQRVVRGVDRLAGAVP